MPKNHDIDSQNHSSEQTTENTSNYANWQNLGKEVPFRGKQYTSQEQTENLQAAVRQSYNEWLHEEGSIAAHERKKRKEREEKEEREADTRARNHEYAEKERREAQEEQEKIKKIDSLQKEIDDLKSQAKQLNGFFKKGKRNQIEAEIKKTIRERNDLILETNHAPEDLGEKPQSAESLRQTLISENYTEEDSRIPYLKGKAQLLRKLDKAGKFEEAAEIELALSEEDQAIVSYIRAKKAGSTSRMPAQKLQKMGINPDSIVL